MSTSICWILLKRENRTESISGTNTKAWFTQKALAKKLEVQCFLATLCKAEKKNLLRFEQIRSHRTSMRWLINVTVEMRPNFLIARTAVTQKVDFALRKNKAFC